MKQHIYTILIFAIVFFFAACTGTKEVVSSTTTESEIVLHREDVWLLEDMSKRYTTSTEQPITLSFNPETGIVRGFAGCNEYYGRYTMHDNNIKITDVKKGNLTCYEQLENIENAYLRALSRINFITISGNTLVLDLYMPQNSSTAKSSTRHYLTFSKQ